MDSQSREELLQTLVEKMLSVMKLVGHSFMSGETALSPPQVRILMSVANKPQGLSAKELAENLGVTPGAVTQFIDVLVEKDLVRREEDPLDRRILRIKITEAARRKLQQFKSNYFASASRVFGVLSDEETEQLIGLLSKVGGPLVKENK